AAARSSGPTTPHGCTNPRRQGRAALIPGRGRGRGGGSGPAVMNPARPASAGRRRTPTRISQALAPRRGESLGRSRSSRGGGGSRAGAAAEMLAGEADGDRALADRRGYSFDRVAAHVADC